ncbi:unnamed protein product, partial [Amoebophrya sp. A25]|eukprot:GSA25T00013754001.1
MMEREIEAHMEQQAEDTNPYGHGTNPFLEAGDDEDSVTSLEQEVEVEAGANLGDVTGGGAMAAAVDRSSPLGHRGATTGGNNGPRAMLGRTNGREEVLTIFPRSRRTSSTGVRVGINTGSSPGGPRASPSAVGPRSEELRRILSASRLAESLSAAAASGDTSRSLAELALADQFRNSNSRGQLVEAHNVDQQATGTATDDHIDVSAGSRSGPGAAASESDGGRIYYAWSLDNVESVARRNTEAPGLASPRIASGSEDRDMYTSSAEGLSSGSDDDFRIGGTRGRGGPRVEHVDGPRTSSNSRSELLARAGSGLRSRIFANDDTREEHQANEMNRTSSFVLASGGSALSRTGDVNDYDIAVVSSLDDDRREDLELEIREDGQVATATPGTLFVGTGEADVLLSTDGLHSSSANRANPHSEDGDDHAVPTALESPPLSPVGRSRRSQPASPQVSAGFRAASQQASGEGVRGTSRSSSYRNEDT